MNNALSTRISSRIPTFGRRALLAACIAAGATFAVHCDAAPWPFGGEQVQGSGRVLKQERRVGHFNGLSLAVPGHVELRIGSSESVTVEADDNLLPLVETVVDNGMLEIRPARRNLNFRSKSIRVVVQARSIERLALGGSGSIDADALRARRLRVDIGGSGSVSLKGVESEALAVAIGGSGELKAGPGTVGTLSVSIGGSGDVDLGRVRASSAEVSIAAFGKATVWPRDALAVSIAGSGDVHYYGDPKVGTSVLGSGSVRRIGASPQ